LRRKGNDMKKSSRKGTKNKIIIAQKTLTVSEVAHRLSPPLGSIEEWAKTKKIAGILRQKILPEVDTFELIESLGRGEIEPFFVALRYDPTVLMNPRIYRQTLGAWFQRKQEEEARALLKRIGEELASTIQGRKPKQNPIPNSEAKSISAGAARLERQYSKWLKIHKKSELALRETVDNYWETAKFSETKRAQIIERFRERIKERIKRGG
jgi:hypothetical protein